MKKIDMAEEQTKQKPMRFSTTAPWIIGGPGTSLPFAVESFLGWSLCIGCLSVSGYYYIVKTVFQPYLERIKQRAHRLMFQQLKEESQIISSEESNRTPSSFLSFPCWLPITTFTKAEVTRATPMERYRQLVQLLYYYSSEHQGGDNQQQPQTVVSAPDKNGLAVVLDAEQKQPSVQPPTLTNMQLIQLLRQHSILRRLATLAMRPPDVKAADSSSCVSELALGQQLIQCWGELLAIPATPTTTANKNNTQTTSTAAFDISLIVPCYRERGGDVRIKLEHALTNCLRPQRVQLVLVNAGECVNFDHAIDRRRRGITMVDTTNTNGNSMNGSYHADPDTHKSTSSVWGEVKLVCFDDDAPAATATATSTTSTSSSNGTSAEHVANNVNNTNSGSGRGPCLNLGAERASGRIFSFCHSDTLLPLHWDEKILQVLDHNDKNNDDTGSPNSCAFGFSVDKSPMSLQQGEKCNNSYYPPGIGAVEWTANCRCQWWSLPYGDQCLSVPARVFWHVGGFPQQPIMEDYDLIKLLRQRAALLPRFNITTTTNNNNNNNRTVTQRERLAMIPGEPARCSPRRWQKYGVLYVTYTNSKLVRQYESNRLTPEDIYHIYYGQSLTTSSSPWEQNVQELLLLIEKKNQRNKIQK